MLPRGQALSPDSNCGWFACCPRVSITVLLRFVSCWPRVLNLLFLYHVAVCAVPECYKRQVQDARALPHSSCRALWLVFCRWYAQCSAHSPATVILFTVICLAMAGHFQSVLAASDLSQSHIGLLGPHTDSLQPASFPLPSLSALQRSSSSSSCKSSSFIRSDVLTVLQTGF